MPAGHKVEKVNHFQLEMIIGHICNTIAFIHKTKDHIRCKRAKESGE